MPAAPPAYLNDPSWAWSTTAPGIIDEYEDTNLVGFDNTIAKFSEQVRYSFSRNFEHTTVSPLKKGNEFATVSEIVNLHTTEILDDDTDLNNIGFIDRKAIQALRQHQTMKMAVAAGDAPTFHKYYPEIKSSYSYFRMVNQQISHAIKTKIPSVVTQGYLDTAHRGELAYVLDALNKTAKTQSQMVLENAGNLSKTITTMIDQWKGGSLKGLSAIIEMVNFFDQRYGTVGCFVFPLGHLLTGYSEIGNHAIHKWRTEKVSAGTPLLELITHTRISAGANGSYYTEAV